MDDALDDALDGGIPRGSLSEWVSGGPSSEGQLAILGLLSEMRRELNFVQFADYPEIIGYEISRLVSQETISPDLSGSNDVYLG